MIGWSLVLGYILQREKWMREREREREIIRIDFFGVSVFILFFIFLIGGVVN